MDIDYRTWLPGLHGLRDALLQTIEEPDLLFNPGGTNPDLRTVLMRWLWTQRDYRQSFERSHLAWSVSSDLLSLSDLREQLAAEDQLLQDVVDRYDENDLSVEVKRPDLSRSRRDHIQAYVQSELMLLATAVVYVRALDRKIPPAVEQYVG